MKNNRICKHLNKNMDLDYILRFTGENNAFDLLCEKCASRIASNFTADLYKIDDESLAKIEEYNWLECKTPVIGEIKLPEFNPDLKFETTPLPQNSLSDKKICALEPHPVGKYFVDITDNGQWLIRRLCHVSV